MNRDRGRGISKNGSKRGLCPECGRKGVKQEEIITRPGFDPVGIRECQYCMEIVSRVRYTPNGPVQENWKRV